MRTEFRGSFSSFARFILSNFTSILVNIPLIRGLTKEIELKKKISFALMFIALAWLVSGAILEFSSKKAE